LHSRIVRSTNSANRAFVSGQRSKKTNKKTLIFLWRAVDIVTLSEKNLFGLLHKNCVIRHFSCIITCVLNAETESAQLKLCQNCILKDV
jgi:hypothetical protein